MTATPLTLLQLEPGQTPSPEHLQLLASDYITRVLALVQKKQPKQALVRVTQLNALVQEFPQLSKAYPALGTFIRYGGHFCSTPKNLTAAAVYLLYQKASPLLKKMTHAVSSYVQEQVETAPQVTEKPRDAKLTHLGNSLAALQAIMPRVLDEDRIRTQAERERYESRHSRSAAAVNADDAFILEQATQSVVQELAATESAFVRLALVLQDAYVSKLVQKAMCLEYGMHQVLGSYWVMTSALLIGVARRTESGETRPDDEIQAHASELLRVRNLSRTRKNQDQLVQIGPYMNSAAHRYFLVFNAPYVHESQFQARRWAFFRMPGVAHFDVHVESPLTLGDA